MTIRVFPIDLSAKVHYSDDFGAPRTGHTHQGNDIFANEGATIFAVDDGTITYGVDPIGGPYFGLRCKDGRYYGAHISAMIDGDTEVDTRTPGFKPLPGRKVSAGEPIARVGHTGNAAGTPPHLHFQMWVGTGPSENLVDPYPYLKLAEGNPPPPTPTPPSPSRFDPKPLPPVIVAAAVAFGVGSLAWFALRAMAERVRRA